MKNQIDNFLLETATPDKDLIGIITHFDRINNVWLCLTELGSTFKIERDSSNDHLSEGKLVRVRYVEQRSFQHSHTIFHWRTFPLSRRYSSGNKEIPLSL